MDAVELSSQKREKKRIENYFDFISIECLFFFLSLSSRSDLPNRMSPNQKFDEMTSFQCRLVAVNFTHPHPHTHPHKLDRVMMMMMIMIGSLQRLL